MREAPLVNEVRLDTNFVDYLIVATYFVVVLGVGFAAKRYIKSSLDYFLSGRSLPAWITGLAFISANLGATEVLGMAANGAQYGVATVNYYWIGAIPAMVFLGLVMMPFYYGSKVRSVPEYLLLRFNVQSHVFNSRHVRDRDDPDRRREPVRARARAEAAARLADHRRHHRRGGHRRRLHHARRPVVGDLQRGAAVLRDPRGADPDHRDRPASTSAAGAACRTRSRSPRSARPACTRCRAPTPATSPTRSGRAGSGSCSASASCSRSATGRRTSPRSSARCRRRTCRAAERTPLIGAVPKLFLPFVMILPGHDRARGDPGARLRASRTWSTTTRSRC